MHWFLEILSPRKSQEKYLRSDQMLSVLKAKKHQFFEATDGYNARLRKLFSELTDKTHVR